jgi:hypothetical protein
MRRGAIVSARGGCLAPHEGQRPAGDPRIPWEDRPNLLVLVEFAGGVCGVLTTVPFDIRDACTAGPTGTSNPVLSMAQWDSARLMTK